MIGFSRAVLFVLLCAQGAIEIGCSPSDDPRQASSSTTQVSGSSGSTKTSQSAGAFDSPQTVTEGPTRGGKYVARWTSRPPKVPLNQLFSMDVDVALPDGKTPFVGSVKVDAWMPAHRHGLEDVEPESVPVPEHPGRYHVTGMKMHMPGQWEFRVDVGEEANWDVGFYPVYVE